MKKSIVLLFPFILGYFVVAQNLPAELNQTKFEKHNNYFDIENNESNIRFDSVEVITPYDVFKEIYSYNENGYKLSVLLKNIYEGELTNNSLLSYSYDSQGNRLTEQLEGWSYTNNHWVKQYLYKYSYDAENNLLSELFQDWDNESWVNSYLTGYTYDDNGFILTKTTQIWAANNWENEFFSEYELDSSGNILQETRHKWENNEWVLNVLYTYTFDENGNKLLYLWQFWVNNEWKNYKLNTYTYDTYGNNLSHLIQNWEENSWVNTFIHTSTYDSNERRLTWLIEVWSETNWANNRLYTYTYTTEGMLESSLKQQWLNNWLNESLYSYSYDENDQLQNILLQHEEDGSWVNKVLTEYNYMPGHINTIAFEWNGSSWVEITYGTNIDIYVDGEIVLTSTGITIDLYYSGITGIEEQPPNVLDSKILFYPNPVTNNEIHLKIDESLYSSPIVFELKNISGQKVKSFEHKMQIFQQEINIDVKDLPSGVYFLVIKTESSSISQKLIIAK